MFRQLKKERSGVVLITVLIMIMVMMVMAISIVSVNVSQVKTVEDVSDNLTMEAVAKGYYWKVYFNQIQKPGGIYCETVGGREYVVTVVINSDPPPNPNVSIDVTF